MHREISLAIRTLRKNPGFTAVASITLAIGIGANTAVFSLIEALLLRSLPVERPAELAVLGPGALGTISMSDRPQSEVFSFAQFQALRDRSNGVVTGVAATPTVDNRVYWGERAASASDLQRASCVLVSGSYFPLLGVRPFRGRLLGPEDDEAPGAKSGRGRQPCVLARTDWVERPTWWARRSASTTFPTRSSVSPSLRSEDTSWSTRPRSGFRSRCSPT